MKSTTQPTRSEEREVRFQTLVGYRLRTLTGHLADTIETLLIERVKITLFEWRIVAALWEAKHDNEEATAAAIGPKVMLDKMQTSRNVNRLVERGFVKSVVHPNDGRALMLRLTAKGKRAYRASMTIVSTVDTRLFASLTKEERRTFEATLDKLVEQAKHLRPQMDLLRISIASQERRK